MKKIYMLGLALLAGTMSFAQQANKELVRKAANPMERVAPRTNHTQNQTKMAILWSNDFSDAATWTITNNNTGGMEEEWSFVTDPALIPVSALSPFESETASNGYLFVNSDGNNSTDGDGTRIITTATTNETIDLTGYTSVLLQFAQNYRWWHDTRTVRVSGDGGLNYTDYLLTDSDNYDDTVGPYTSGEQNSGNPYITSIDISDVAGDMSDVKIQFVYDDNDIWAWYWAIDDVKILEKPDNDVQINYSVVSQNPNDGIEYGRVPLDQITDGLSLSVNAYNFGVNEQTNVTVVANFTNGTTTITETQTVASIAPDTYENITFPIQTDLTTGIYEGTFTITSDQETDGEFFDNNVDTRRFEITDGVYSQDGIGLYNVLAPSAMGPGSFLNSDNDNAPFETGAFMAQYDLRGTSIVTGVRILLADVEGNEGSLIYSFIADTADVLANDISNKLTESDPYTLTAADVAAGFVDLNFIEAIELSANTYYAGVQVEEGAGFRVLDDATVVQPVWASAIFLDQTYSNGVALGIQLNVSWVDAIDEMDTKDFTVSQNTPNPANNTTLIEYNLTNANKVSLNIVDITGKTVKTINEGTKAAGSHSITIDVKDLSAGVYTYTLTVGTNQITKRMIIE